jgi:DNA repair protein RecO (recombination protein O)
MIVTTDAVVLRAVKYGDTSKVVTLYTRGFGRVTVMAKGVRSQRSRFGSSLQPLALVRAVFYKKEGRDVHLVSQCDLRRAHTRITEDIDRFVAACAVVELVEAAVRGEEPSEPLFLLLEESLDAIDHATKSPFPALYYNEIHMAGILGFQPDFSRCTLCGTSLEDEQQAGGGAYLDALRGGLVCTACVRGGHEEPALSTVAIRALQRFSALRDAASALRVVLPQNVEKEVGAVLRRYLKVHVEGLRTSRTDRVAAVLGEIPRTAHKMNQ